MALSQLGKLAATSALMALSLSVSNKQDSEIQKPQSKKDPEFTLFVSIEGSVKSGKNCKI